MNCVRRVSVEKLKVHVIPEVSSFTVYCTLNAFLKEVWSGYFVLFNTSQI